MENKKVIIGIIIVLILIITLVGTSYLYTKYNAEQLNLLTDETNNILKADIVVEEIDSEIKTEKNYAVVEKSIKEYIAKIKNIYSSIDKINDQINPNDIFSAKNVEDKNLEEIETILADYKEKAKNIFIEYQELVSEENILNYIKDKEITVRQDYFIDLYNSAMLNDVMKEKYSLIESRIETKRDDLYYKIDQLGKVKEFLEENEKYWSIKDGKIQFSNVNKVTEYYSLLNRIEE